MNTSTAAPTKTITTGHAVLGAEELGKNFDDGYSLAERRRFLKGAEISARWHS